MGRVIVFIIGVCLLIIILGGIHTGLSKIIPNIFNTILPTIVSTILGTSGVFMLAFKFFLSESSATRAARRQFTEKTTGEISDLAKTHYWSLANYSGVVAGQLERYLNLRTQLLLMRWDSLEDLKEEINKESRRCADETFYGLCRLLLLFDEFQFKSSNTYLLTRRSSGELALKLYNAFMTALPRDDEKIETLKIVEVLQMKNNYISSIIVDPNLGTDAGDARGNGHQFYDMRVADLPASAFMSAVETGRIPLKDVLDRFRRWINEKGGSVEQAAQALRAYSELLMHELSLLYEDWFSRKSRSGGWPSDEISIDSEDTFRRVRYQSVLLTPMTRESKAPPTEKEPPTEKVSVISEKATPHGISQWLDDKGEKERKEYEPLPPAQSEDLSQREHRYDWEQLKIKIHNWTASAKRSCHSFLIRLKSGVSSFYEGIRNRVSSFREQAGVIEQGNFLSLYAMAIEAYMNEEEDTFIELAHKILPRLPAKHFVAQRSAMVLYALSGHVMHRQGKLEDATAALMDSAKIAKRLYARIASMKEESRDRRTLPDYASFRAIVNREIARAYLDQHQFGIADHLLDEAISLEPEWSSLLVLKWGIRLQLEAKKLGAEGKRERAIERFDQSREELDKLGLRAAAGVTAFEKAIYCRDKKDLKNAYESMKDSLKYFESTKDYWSIATIHQYSAELLVKPDDVHLEAVNHYLSSAEAYQKAKGFVRSAEMHMLAGDLLATQPSLTKAEKSYKDGIMQALEFAKQKNEYHPITDKLLCRQALIGLAEDNGDKCNGRLAALIHRWNQGDGYTAISDWGPYYTAVSQAWPVLKNRGVLNAVKIHYQALLREQNNLAAARDLTASLMSLYGYTHISEDDTTHFFPDTARCDELYNVNTPLLVEVSETAAEPGLYDNESLMAHAEPIRNAIMTKFGVRMPGIRVRPNIDLHNDEYILMINEVPVDRGVGGIDKVFHHLKRMVAANLVDFFGHQEVQNFLERSLLVALTIADLAEKEHCGHMDMLCAVLRALVMERVPLAWPGHPLLTTDVKDLDSLADKLRQKPDPVSVFIVDHLSGKTNRLLSDYEKGIDSKELLQVLVEDLNTVIESQKIYDKPRFGQVSLSESTNQILNQKEWIREEPLLNRMLLQDAYSKELQQNALDYRNRIYETFRAGWMSGDVPWKTVENIRCLPEVRPHLWGNQSPYHHFFLPPSIERFIGSCARKEASYPVLAMDPKQADDLLYGIERQISSDTHSALVIHQREHRPMVRSLIAHRLPEVPVLSVHELLAGGPVISTLSNFKIRGVHIS